MSEKKIRILLVDDDIETRGMYAEVFKTANFEVLQANDGLDGLDIASKNFPDIIFTGVVMPRMDGFAMMDALKKTVTTANIPVVISSHMGREEDQRRANQLGAKDFIVRDTTPPNEVLDRISEVLIQEGGSYAVDFNPYAFDAQKLARDLSFNLNYQCLECDEKLILQLNLKNARERVFEARFVCAKCGWIAK
jgi:DNA-binding response OmpR family regulator